MNTYKVSFKGKTPVLVKAKDDLDAAQKVAQANGYDLKTLCYAIKVEDLKPDVWGDAA